MQRPANRDQYCITHVKTANGTEQSNASHLGDPGVIKKLEHIHRYMHYFHIDRSARFSIFNPRQAGLQLWASNVKRLRSSQTYEHYSERTEKF